MNINDKSLRSDIGLINLHTTQHIIRKHLKDGQQ